MGYIYIIKNDFNDKVYIGKTIKSVETRWKCHLSRSHNKSIKNKLYSAMRTLGEEHFYIETLGEFDNNDLDAKEVEYIRLYNSFHNGYNSTKGGEINSRTSDEDIEYIVEMYRNGYTYAMIQYLTGHSFETIKYILLGEGLNLPDKSSKCIGIVMYDKSFNPQMYFRSKKLAYNYMVEVENIKCNLGNFMWHINNVLDTGGIRFGHRWQLADDLVIDDKIFKTKFDAQRYKEGNVAQQTERGYFEVNIPNIDNKKINKCKQCGKRIGYNNKKGYCISCIKALGKPIKPSREQLIDDAKNMNKQQIADKYKRSKSTVVYWFNSYGL